MDEVQKNLKHNFIVNMVDAIFFGMGIGISSFNTVIPLFVATMTNSATLIGLIPAIHNTGWQFPQLFTAHRITRMPRFKPFVILMTIQERIPFLGLAVVALLSPKIGPTASLVLTYILLIWQGMGAGMTANAWQNMVSRIIPSHVLATFFGLQTGASNLLSSVGAVIAGFLLAKMQSPGSYALCFVITFGLMAASYASLSLTREHKKPDLTVDNSHADFWRNVITIMKKDEPFRWFIISRNAFQFGMMAQAFFIIYAIKVLKMNLEAAGILTGLLFFTQVLANPILGWIADKWNSSNVIKGGAASIGLASLLAYWAPDPSWFYLVIILSGTASTAFWTIGIAKSLEFGTEEEKPTYVGLSNTLIAPSTILAPLLGGWLADVSGYSTTFLTAAMFATLGVVIMQIFVKDRGKKALQA
ncbi:MAG: MFS transporter [Leptolinea sp.]|jgi:MFS family permease|nr:MFS transporter [Leptolinea sp.]